MVLSNDDGNNPALESNNAYASPRAAYYALGILTLVYTVGDFARVY